MTTRPDVEIDFIPSPRVAEVAEPSTEFIAQDIVDTLRIREESFRGQSEDKLVNASGKEDLGGGVSVGITVELQDTLVAFEGRTTPAQIGIVTTGFPTPVNNQLLLIDSNATFITNEIHRGSLVINFTDESIAEVTEIQSETILRTKVLVNGSTNVFNLNDSYQVFNVIQCDLTGGNVVAVDENDNSISPVLPTAFTQVIRTASSSATTQNQVALNFATYQNRVAVDQTSIYTGTKFPVGTSFQPVNNFADAHEILDTLGFDTIKINGSATITSEDFGHGGTDVHGVIFEGGNQITNVLTVDPGATIDNCVFKSVFITGTLDNENIIRDSIVGSLVSLDGFVERSLLIGTITLGGAGRTDFIDCWTDVANNGVTIDMGGSGSIMSTQKFAGVMTITNKTGPESAVFDLNQGSLIIDSSVTNGTITVIGVGLLTDNSTGSTIVDSFLLNNDTIAARVWDYDPSLATANSMGSIQRRVAFEGQVHVSQNNGLAGTAYPLGTANNPVNNIADAVTIANTNGIQELHIDEDITITATDNVDNFIIYGSHAEKSQITLQAGASTQLTQFFNCKLTGTPGGRITIKDAITEDLNDFEGIIHQTVINGFIKLGTKPNALSYILDCFSGVPGSSTPELDFNNSTHSVAIRNYNGGIKFTNKTQPQPVSIDFNSGQIILDGTVTAGEIVIRGIYSITDNSGGTTTIVQNTNLDDIEIKIDNIQTDIDAITIDLGNVSLVIDDLIKYQRNKSIIDPLNSTLTIYEDDGTTPLTVFDLQDSNGVASVTSIFRRIPQ